MAKIMLAVWLFGAFIKLVIFALNMFGKLLHDSAKYAGANAFGCILTSSYAIVN